MPFIGQSTLILPINGPLSTNIWEVIMNEKLNMKDAFIYVNEIYRNCARILISADILMEERGYVKYNWKNMYDMEPIENTWRSNTINNLKQADSILPGYLFHQYYQRDLQNRDIITICTAPWRIVNSNTFYPACCLTRFLANSTSDHVYWIGAMPVWEKSNKIDGIVREYDSVSVSLQENFRDKFTEVVSDEKKLIGVSIPLQEITSSTEIETRLIKPLLVDRAW
jgi:hypothetical protein